MLNANLSSISDTSWCEQILYIKLHNYRFLVVHKTIAKTLENTEGMVKEMDAPEKLATQVTQDEEKQNKNTRQHASDTTTRNQTRMVRT